MKKKDLVVLAVDDDIINLKLIKSMLKKNENIKEILEARDGFDAMQELKTRHDIDLILLDIIMPIMGGIEMLQMVRADKDLAQLPIIILTTDETKKSEALEFGANEFLMKPIRNEELLSKIAKVLL